MVITGLYSKYRIYQLFYMEVIYMTTEEELYVLDSILNFNIPNISEQTRFWMIRTKKGYFYNEFISGRYVALAWNLISKQTDFSEQSSDLLNDSIRRNYRNIQRPATVINKCKTFINEVNENDIIIIPSAGSTLITFAYAGAYFEADNKTVELENRVISSIENNEIHLGDDVSCPYMKRRHIHLIKTLPINAVHHNLIRAISNYHGISNLDTYYRYILGAIFPLYSYNNNINLIYNVTKEAPIGPRTLSTLLFGTTDYLCHFIDERSISTQININSPGPIDFSLVDAFNTVKDNYLPIVAILVFVGGGSFLTCKLPGLPKIIHEIFTLPDNIKQTKADAKQHALEAELKELEVIQKKIEIHERIKATGIDPAALVRPIDYVIEASAELEVDNTTVNNVIYFVPAEASQEDE
jgi:hypothetical protein